MKKLTLGLHVPFPIFLKRIKFFEVGKVDRYEDEKQKERAFNELETDLVAILKTIKANKKLNEQFRINVILSNTIVGHIADRTSELKALLKNMNRNDQITISLDCSNFQKYPFFGEMMKKGLAQFTEVFGNSPVTYIGCKSFFTKTATNSIINLAANGLFQMPVVGKREFFEAENLRRISLPGATRLLKNQRLRKSWQEYQTLHNVHGFVVNYREAYKLVHSNKIISCLLKIKNTEFVRQDGKRLFQTKSKTVTKHNSAGNGVSSELQVQAMSQLLSLSKGEALLKNKYLSQQYSFLCQNELFGMMDTRNPDSYGSLNPYQSPYETYINTMNILNDFQIKVTQQVS